MLQMYMLADSKDHPSTGNDRAPSLGGTRRTHTTRQEPGLGGEAALLRALEALHDEDDKVRARAAGLLGQIGDGSAVESLREALRDNNGSVRGRAARALGRIGDKSVLPDLLQAIHDPDPAVRQAAAEALGLLGTQEALESLTEALQDSDIRVRQYAIEALGVIGNVCIVPDLLNVLRDGSYLTQGRLRLPVIQALARIGADAVTALIYALEDQQGRISSVATEALGLIGRQVMDAEVRVRIVSALVERLHHPTPYVSRMAARSLGQIGEHLSDVELLATIARALLAALEDHEAHYIPIISWESGGIIYATATYALADDCDLRSDVADVLGLIGAQLEESVLRAEIVDVLIELLNDGERGVRQSAARALGRIGDARAVPALIQRLSDVAVRPFSREPCVAEVAAEALEHIGTPEAAAAVGMWRAERHKE